MDDIVFAESYVLSNILHSFRLMQLHLKSLLTHFSLVTSVFIIGANITVPETVPETTLWNSKIISC